MKNIYILEHFDFTKEQLDKLNQLGNIKYYEKAEQKDIDEAVQKADIILLDWLDPTDIITKMKKGSFICLPYTGYEWIKTLKQAIDGGVIISNTPNYSTNAVAEHHLGLILASCKHILYFNEFMKANKQVPFNRSIELIGKTVGIIGMGNIGKRLATLLKGFGVNFLTTNRTAKNIEGIKDVDLDTLLKESDVVCVTCQLNACSKNMISTRELNLMKDNAVLTATTGGVIDLQALTQHLNCGKLFAVGLDDMDQQEVPQELINNPKVVATYHRAFDTQESENNRINMCIDNIEAYIKGDPINLIKV